MLVPVLIPVISCRSFRKDLTRIIAALEMVSNSLRAIMLRMLEISVTVIATCICLADYMWTRVYRLVFSSLRICVNKRGTHSYLRQIVDVMMIPASHD